MKISAASFHLQGLEMCRIIHDLFRAKINYYPISVIPINYVLFWEKSALKYKASSC